MDHSISEAVVIIRLCLAFAAGGLIGLERSSRRQVAGLRTHILIAVGASCLMLLSIWLPQSYALGDPGRIAAQVVSGIGFLGAGAIIRLGANTRGLTTAASLWLTAAVGMTVGAGMYVAALATVILALITLIILNKIEIKIFPETHSKSLEISYNHGKEPDITPILEILKIFKIESQTINIASGNRLGKKTKLSLLVTIRDATDISKLAKSLKSCGGVERVELNLKP